MALPGGSGKTPRALPGGRGLPQILGVAPKAESPKVSTTPRLQTTYGEAPLLWPQRSQSSPSGPEQLGGERGRMRATFSERPSMLHVMRWVERELQYQGLETAGPSLDRVRVFSSAFGEVIDMLPTYRPFLLLVQKEYDALITQLQAELSATAPLEGRLKTIKAESLTFVGESMTWFQSEIDQLRRRLSDVQSKRDALASEKVQLNLQLSKLQEASEKNKDQATQSQVQNMDILKQLERMHQQVEILQNKERKVDSDNKRLEDELKKKEKRIQTSEELVSQERMKSSNMVPKEKFEEAMEQVRHLTQSNAELKDMYAAKHKDYLAFVELHTSKTGQTLSQEDQVKPLTPRPKWSHCGGMLDPEDTRSQEKAGALQEILQQVLVRSRTLLCAYGLSAAAQKSRVFQAHASQRALAAPLAGAGAPGGSSADVSPRPTSKQAQRAEAEGEDAAARDSASRASGPFGEDPTFGPDFDEDLPAELRPTDKVPNLLFSRRKVSDFMEGLLERRQKYSPHDTGPFAKYMAKHLPEGESNENGVFIANIWAGVRRYSAEPDFLAYSLLLRDKISYTVVRDNKGICKELMNIFTTEFESEDKSDWIPKQKFYYGLQEVLPNKSMEMCQDLSHIFPAGGPDTAVNFKWLLQEDLYMLSPVVYTLRLQHLEECVALGEKLVALTSECARGSPKTVTFAAVDEAFDNEPALENIQEQDLMNILRKAFQTDVLEADTEQEWDKFIEVIKQGEIFRKLYFPELLPEEDEEA